MSIPEIVTLAAAACAAGSINAVAGGGTLLTFPALILFGTPSITANATSTLALVVGTGGSLFGFRRRIALIRPWLFRFLPVSLLGGWLGSVLLTRTQQHTFDRLVPFLILFATVLFFAQGAVRKLARAEERVADSGHRGGSLWIALLFQFVVALYGGYFGAGIGILMLASLGFLGHTDIHEMNALKNVLGSMINLVAALWFIVSGLIDWPKMAIMSVGALIGYYLGAHFSQRIPQQRVRQLINVIGLTISAVMFYKQFKG